MVDDVATNRMILNAKLSASYFDVLLAENGRDAVRIAQEAQPDVVLLDVLMPGMDGFETCRLLKSDPATCHIPVILVTALNDESHRLQGLSAGADDFISKPIDDLALFSRVRNLLRSKFMMDELRLRDRTTRDLGLYPPEEPNEFTLPSQTKLSLIAPPNHVSQSWMDALAGMPRLSVSVHETPARPAPTTDTHPTDIYLVYANLLRAGDGLRLVSQLRSRQETRQSVIVLVVPKGDRMIAAKGLDLGASDFVEEGVSTEELVMRLESQRRQKSISDRLRNNVTDTLRLAVLDPLTGLYNRRYASRHLMKIAKRARDTGKGFALMLLDIDKFKRVNDVYGHTTGDNVLKEFSSRIQEKMRNIDLVARLGGEEFLIAMPDTTEGQARAASERLRRAIEETRFYCGVNDENLRITVSIGVTLGDPGKNEVEALIEEADRALYASKSEGRNTVTLFHSAA